MYWSSYLTSTEKKQESDQWNKLTNFIFNSVKLRNKHSEYTVYFLDFFVIFLLELHHKKSVYFSVSLTLCKKKKQIRKKTQITEEDLLWDLRWWLRVSEPSFLKRKNIFIFITSLFLEKKNRIVDIQWTYLIVYIVRYTAIYINSCDFL